MSEKDIEETAIEKEEPKQFPLSKKEFEQLSNNLVPGTKSVKKEFLTVLANKLGEVEAENGIK